MTPDERQELMDAALEGDILEADFVRLEAELSLDQAALQEYLERVQLSLLLETEAIQAAATRPTTGAVSTNTSASSWRRAAMIMATACTLLLAIVGWQWLLSPGPSEDLATSPSQMQEPEKEVQASGFAVLSAQSEAVWGDESPTVGMVVPPGELHLQSGVAQFELFSGVAMVVEGDARFSILSPMEVSLGAGKVRARVPEPAHGFRLLTAAGEVVDLGTEFAVDVTSDSSEIHVLDGAVEWHPSGRPSMRLDQGSATRSSNRGQESLAANYNVFVSIRELQDRLRSRQASRVDSWRKASRLLSGDPRVIAHYQMTGQPRGYRRLPNLASGSSTVASEGAIVAASTASNRWGQLDGALDFSPAGSRVRMRVPGVYQNLTLICWVRINSLDRWYNSLFLTDGHEQGEPHWQIMDDGRLFFSVKKRDVFDKSKGEKDKHVFYSPPFWNSSLSGHWLMLVTVYDGASQQVTHYLNGAPLSREAIPAEYLVSEIRIGDASLCNWGLPERDQPQFAIRNLNGSMDEFVMLQDALSGDEILELYEVGKP